VRLPPFPTLASEFATPPRAGAPRVPPGSATLLSLHGRIIGNGYLSDKQLFTCWRNQTQTGPQGGIAPCPAGQTSTGCTAFWRTWPSVSADRIGWTTLEYGGSSAPAASTFSSNPGSS